MRKNQKRPLGGLPFTPFSAALANLLGDNEAALLMAELEYWFDKKAKPQSGWRQGSIYKELEGSPQSLGARLNLKGKAIRRALNKIAVPYESPKELPDSSDRFLQKGSQGAMEEMPYATVRDRAARCTRIFRNGPRVRELLKEAAALNAGAGSSPSIHLIDPEDLGFDAFANTGGSLPVESSGYDPYDQEQPTEEAAVVTMKEKPYDPYDVD